MEGQVTVLNRKEVIKMRVTAADKWMLRMLRFF